MGKRVVLYHVVHHWYRAHLYGHKGALENTAEELGYEISVEKQGALRLLRINAGT